MPIGRTRLFADPRMARHTLRELDRRKPAIEPSFFNDNSERPAAENNPGRFIFVGGTTDEPQYSDGSEWRSFLSSVMYDVPAFVFGTANAAGVSTSVVRKDATLAIFDATVPAGLATAAATGSAAIAARRDHVHEFPATVQSAANDSTLILTDDATDQTFTGSLGSLLIRSASGIVTLPKWTVAAGGAPLVGDVFGF